MNFDTLPKVEAGCKMPSAKSIDAQDRYRTTTAEIANDAMVNALHRYSRSHDDASAMVIRRAWEARG